MNETIILISDPTGLVIDLARLLAVILRRPADVPSSTLLGARESRKATTSTARKRPARRPGGGAHRL